MGGKGGRQVRFAPSDASSPRRHSGSDSEDTDGLFATDIPSACDKLKKEQAQGLAQYTKKHQQRQQSGDGSSHPTSEFFAHSGIRLEPFSLRDEVRGGILTKEGVYRMARERDGSCERQEDDEDYEREEDAFVRGLKEKQGVDGIEEQESGREKREDEGEEVESQGDEKSTLGIQIKLLTLLEFFMKNYAEKLMEK